LKETELREYYKPTKFEDLAYCKPTVVANLLTAFSLARWVFWGRFYCPMGWNSSQLKAGKVCIEKLSGTKYSGNVPVVITDLPLPV